MHPEDNPPEDKSPPEEEIQSEAGSDFGDLGDALDDELDGDGGGAVLGRHGVLVVAAVEERVEHQLRDGVVGGVAEAVAVQRRPLEPRGDRQVHHAPDHREEVHRAITSLAWKRHIAPGKEGPSVFSSPNSNLHNLRHASSIGSDGPRKELAPCLRPVVNFHSVAAVEHGGTWQRNTFLEGPACVLGQKTSRSGWAAWRAHRGVRWRRPARTDGLTTIGICIKKGKMKITSSNPLYLLSWPYSTTLLPRGEDVLGDRSIGTVALRLDPSFQSPSNQNRRKNARFIIRGTPRGARPDAVFIFASGAISPAPEWSFSGGLLRTALESNVAWNHWLRILSNVAFSAEITARKVGIEFISSLSFQIMVF
uniref:Uncharacterized protein n=1 Tax=Steinernema glaseri TaxID=37863 RepID=A0A1I8ACH7_9BILA